MKDLIEEMLSFKQLPFINILIFRSNDGLKMLKKWIIPGSCLAVTRVELILVGSVCEIDLSTQKSRYFALYSISSVQYIAHIATTVQNRKDERHGLLFVLTLQAQPSF